MNFLRISCSDLAYLTGRVKYLHNGKSVSSGAFEKTSPASFEFLLPRRWGASSVGVTIYAEDGTRLAERGAEYSDFDCNNDIFSVDLSALGLPVGLYFLKLKIETVAGALFGTKGNEREIRLSENEGGEPFQFSIVDFKYPAPCKYCGGVIYHVFVDRFCRGGVITPRADAIMVQDWDGIIPEYPEYPGAFLENNTFFGGTLYGVVEKLDYIKSLGTTLIYLSPIFEAYSNHKYDTGDYMTVDSMFGGEDALKLLITEAKKRGIGIILDGVFNHTGADSIYFNKKGRYSSLGAYQSKDSTYYSWFDFKHFPDSYTCWWNIEILPRINPEIKECAEFFVGKGGVIEKYAKLGIAGLRLDVADELSDNFIAGIKSALENNSSESVLYGEVWEDASNKIAYGKRKKYYLGTELDGVMNYPVRVGIIDYIRDKRCDSLRYALSEVMFNTPKRIRDMQMNLLGTHDTERIITVLAGASAKGKTNKELSTTFLSESERDTGIRRVKLAYTLLATLPGIPTVFYGDEAGLEGYRDPFNRRPFPWNNINAELLEYYRRIGEIRSASEVYTDGEFELVYMTESSLAYKRVKENLAYVTVINNSDNALNINFSKRAKNLLSDESGQTFAIAGECAAIFKINSIADIEIL